VPSLETSGAPGYAVSLLEHSLQSVTWAERDGKPLGRVASHARIRIRTMYTDTAGATSRTASRAVVDQLSIALLNTDQRFGALIGRRMP
jgi:predicted HD phosphohydrolase